MDFPVGDSQLLVLYVTGDTGTMVDPVAVTGAIASDADARRVDGWRLASLTSLPLRQTGTTGNVFFQSGGAYATQEGLIALYTK